MLVRSLRRFVHPTAVAWCRRLGILSVRLGLAALPELPAQVLVAALVFAPVLGQASSTPTGCRLFGRRPGGHWGDSGNGLGASQVTWGTSPFLQCSVRRSASVDIITCISAPALG